MNGFTLVMATGAALPGLVAANEALRDATTTAQSIERLGIIAIMALLCMVFGAAALYERRQHSLLMQQRLLDQVQFRDEVLKVVRESIDSNNRLRDAISAFERGRGNHQEGA